MNDSNYRSAFITVSMIFLAGCTQPLNSSRDNADAIASALGERRNILDSGIYRIATLSEKNSESETLFKSMLDGSSAERPEHSEFFAVQWHSGSKTYATSWGNVAFYDYDGQYHIMEWRTALPQGGSVYFPVEAAEGRITVYGYSCDDVPQNYKQAKALGDDCVVLNSETMLRAMGLMNFDQMDKYGFEIHSKINDFGDPL